MQKFKVTGMSCAACSARVEKAVNSLEGVSECQVNLLTGDMLVEGDADNETIIAAVKSAGYGVLVEDQAKASKSYVSEPQEKTKNTLKHRLIWSVVLLLILMYFSMGHTMWGFPLPAALHHNHIALALIQLLLTTAVMVINQHFFINGFKGLIKGAPNMDTLVALGAAAAYGYSCYVLFAMSSALVNGGDTLSYMHDLYFESAAMILTLITVGKLLESRAKGKTTNAIKALMRLSPKTACVVRGGKEHTINAEDVIKGDVFIVRPGESIPVDGVVLEGLSAVDESALTGESVPADKQEGSRVSSGTINKTGRLVCRATAVGEDSTISQIIKMVSDAAATKAPIARIADKVSGIFVPVVLGIALITLIVWLLLGETAGFALARAISVLVISCPCALGLATPVAIMVGSGVGAKHGVLFKTAASLEECGRGNIIVLDKTGTITSGKPQITDIIPLKNISEDILLKTAVSLENPSAHPLAQAVIKGADEKGITPIDVTDFREKSGSGVEAKIDGKLCFAGNLRSVKELVEVSKDIEKTADKLSIEGKTPLFFAEENELLGIIAVADTVKSESAAAVKQLKGLGLRVVMLTGDNEKTANAVAKRVGIDEVVSGVMPQGKAQAVSQFKQQGRVIMVGDGINDAPALTIADIGIAIGSGMDVAIDAADVVLMKSSIEDVVTAIRLSRATITNIRQNLFWAFVYNCIGIPLAAGAFISLLGWAMNPMFGAAAMSLSSFCVVSNALRLNFFKVKPIKKEKEKMTKTIKIDGMMCPHCEAHVKNALEAIEGVATVDASHQRKDAVVTHTAEVSNDTLKATVEAQGYKVISIE